jgi:large subunit ribosomal protein L18
MQKRIFKNRKRAQKRVRSQVQGTPSRPRLSVFRSLNNIYAQAIDDTTGKTLLSGSSLSKEIAEEVKNAKSKIEKSAIVGEFVGKKLIEAGITTVVFDRGWYRYHGRVKAVADGARKAGLKF